VLGAYILNGMMQEKLPMRFIMGQDRPNRTFASVPHDSGSFSIGIISKIAEKKPEYQY